MNKIKVYGSSDDLIEIEGDISEEFNFSPDKSSESRVLAFSDGTLLRIHYDDDAIWRITRMVAGAAKFEKIEGNVQEDTPDIVTLSGAPITWVVLGEQHATQ